VEHTVKSFFYSGCLAAVAIFVSPCVANAQGVTSNAFNPALSVILDGKYAHYSSDPKQYAISGFLLADEAKLAPMGFSIGESEIAASANVDDKLYAQLTVSLAALDSGTEVNVEEAFIQSTSLPYGLTAKAGRFFSDIGYLNSKHAHAWDFVDQPLVYRAMLGNQYGDDGVQVRWVAPLDLLVEVGGEALRGAQFPAAGATHGGLGAWSLFAHVGGDINSEQSWRAGMSYLSADAEQRESTIQNGDSVAFTGTSGIWIADFVWKWADHGNPKTRNLVIQGEYLHRQEQGVVADATLTSTYSGTQQGFYLQAAYQFMPRWRVGLRFDMLSADNNGPTLGVVTPLNDTSHDPSRVTAMVDFSNSEFSRFRLQLAEDKSRPQSDTQFFFQYVVSIGAHGAHQF
jgi:hypothetical protein